jgi:LysR family nitrogen assimilation transcriptional regulator
LLTKTTKRRSFHLFRFLPYSGAPLPAVGQGENGWQGKEYRLLTSSPYFTGTECSDSNQIETGKHLATLIHMTASMGSGIPTGGKMNFRRLKYFVKIVDIGSLTQAAEVLHIAQPALSQQVATLEGELDQQLLIRTKRGVTPTEAGKMLYTHARMILRQCEQAQLAVSNIGQTLSGQVSIGLAPGTAASSITMPLLQAVRAELPEVLIYLHENSGAVLNDKLLSGQLDMAVLYERSPIAGITSQPLLKEDLFLVGTRDCPGQSVDLTAVAQMNLFLPRDYSAVRLRVDEAFSLRRLTAKVIGEIESISTLTAAIASGMGVTVLPESAARSLCNAANGWMARITTPSMSLPLSLNVSARGSLSPQAQAVKEILLSLVSCPALENRELQLVS